MTQDDIIHMTIEASATGCADELTGDAIARFAKLVEDKTRQELRDEIVYKWVPPSFVDYAIKAEREACANLCSSEKRWWDGMSHAEKDIYQAIDNISAVIRARGE